MTILRQPTRAGCGTRPKRSRASCRRRRFMCMKIKGMKVAFKAESLQPIGAFKIRGAWHRLTALDAETRARASSPSPAAITRREIAWAAKRLGMPATIVMPADAPRAKAGGHIGRSGRRWSDTIGDRKPRGHRARLAEARGANPGAEFRRSLGDRGAGECGIEAEAQMAALGLGAPRRVVVPCGGRRLVRGAGARLKMRRSRSWSPRAGTTCAAAWRRHGSSRSAPTRRRRLRCAQTPRVSPLTFDVLARRDATGVAVSEAETAAAQRWAAEHLRLVVEPAAPWGWRRCWRARLRGAGAAGDPVGRQRRHRRPMRGRLRAVTAAVVLNPFVLSLSKHGVPHG